MIVVAAVIAYLIGSIPTADWVGRLYGVDPRAEGTGNPGAANTLGLAGKWAGATVLLADFARGAAAVVIGRVLVGDAGGLVAAIAATSGQKFNPWFGFRGGKGLAVSAGAFLVVWPWGVAVGFATILGFLALTRSTARAALGALTVMVAQAALWAAAGINNLWGVRPTYSLLTYALVLTAMLAPKFIGDLRAERTAGEVLADGDGPSPTR